MIQFDHETKKLKIGSVTIALLLGVLATSVIAATINSAFSIFPGNRSFLEILIIGGQVGIPVALIIGVPCDLYMKVFRN